MVLPLAVEQVGAPVERALVLGLESLKAGPQQVFGLALSRSEVDVHGEAFGANVRAMFHEGDSLACTGEALDGAGPHVGARVGLPQAEAVKGGLGCSVARPLGQVCQQGADSVHGARSRRLLRHVE